VLFIWEEFILMFQELYMFNKTMCMQIVHVTAYRIAVFSKSHINCLVKGK
jgi:hypothetical protein